MPPYCTSCDEFSNPFSLTEFKLVNHKYKKKPQRNYLCLKSELRKPPNLEWSTITKDYIANKSRIPDTKNTKLHRFTISGQIEILNRLLLAIQKLYEILIFKKKYRHYTHLLKNLVSIIFSLLHKYKVCTKMKHQISQLDLRLLEIRKHPQGRSQDLNIHSTTAQLPISIHLI